MRNLIAILLLSITMFSSCTQDNIIDSGTSSGIVDANMYDYMNRQDEMSVYNWALTVEMIDHAGLTDLFKGEDPDHPDIMFLGITSHSIRRWYLDQDLTSVQETDSAECREILLKHVFDESYLRDDIPLLTAGGVVVTSIEGTRVRIYSEELLDPVYGVGPIVLYFESVDNDNVSLEQIASADIQPTNGVVHSIHYDYILGAL